MEQHQEERQKEKAVIYIRTSTTEQNPLNQIKDCEELVNSLNLINLEVIEDKQSAWKDHKEREGFEKVKALINQRKINHLIVWDFDRVYRNRLRFKGFLEYLKINNVKLHSFRQSWFEEFHKIPYPYNDIVSDLMINLFGHLAEEESNKKSQRVKLAVRKQEGQKTKSYKGNVWGRKPLSSNVINQVLEFHKQGKSIRQITSLVFYWDKNNNKRQLSKSAVHKIVSDYTPKNKIVNDSVQQLDN